MGDVAALTWPPSGASLGLSRDGPRSIARCLFGPVDHEANQAVLERELEQIYQRDKARWNYDFKAGQPLSPGRYLWEPAVEKRDADNDDAPSAGASTLVQTTIPDFMRKRKSSSNQKETVMPPRKTRRRRCST